MINSELDHLASLLSQKTEKEDTCRQGRLDAEAGRIKKAWITLIFSSATDDCLRRYFHHQLEVLGGLAQALRMHQSGMDQVRVIVDLISDLRVNHGGFFSGELPAPDIYRHYIIARAKPQIEKIRHELQIATIDPLLSSCIFNFIAAMTGETDKAAFSYRALFYFEQWLAAVLTICQHRVTNEQLINTLVMINFNHLEFISAVQKLIRNGAEVGHHAAMYYQEQKSLYALLPADERYAYHPHWPAAGSLIGNWLSEMCAAEVQKLQLAGIDRQQKVQQKLALNLSVAQLACLIKMLYEENQIANGNLSEIFKFFSTHFQTKRQAVISCGSLSKEYYSVDQVTAAGVLGLFKRVVQRINRNFFPG